MIMWDTASARRFGTTSSGRRESNRGCPRPATRIAKNRTVRTVLKSCPEIRNPLDWLPRHGTPPDADAADNFVRNLVKDKNCQFCWTTPSAGAEASERKCTV